ncbi:hypothetical protein [Microbacterium suaedae]|uniref:hypothetical protein n=1 Tax=Microbacterium suaedae TaxID=2067813 RepID=UPI000DA18DF8|nr:hypothetical protein [Microbacterium suaedae]
MRKYLLGTGIIGALTSGWSLLKGSDAQPFTWRVALAWISWGISFALSIGMILDIRKASRGGAVAEDSPIAGREDRFVKSSAAARK